MACLWFSTDFAIAPGYCQTEWHGNDKCDSTVAAGVYFIQMQTSEFESYSKIIFLY
jgi:hypothetical protein